MDPKLLSFYLRHIDWAPLWIRERLRASFLLNWNYWVEQERCLSPPFIVSLRLLPVPDAEPYLCGQMASFGDAAFSTPREQRGIIGKREIEGLVEEVARWRSILHIWGGEPFLYPYILDLLSLAKSRKIFCRVNTDGAYLERCAEDLVKIGVDELVFSLDGPAFVYDQFRSVPGTFKRVSSGLARLRSVKEKMRRRKPVLRGSMLVVPENYQKLDETLDLASSLKLESFQFVYVPFVTESAGDHNNQFFLDNFSCPSDSWRRFHIDIKSIEAAALVRKLYRLKHKPTRIPTGFHPPLRRWQIAHYFDDSTYAMAKERCRLPWFVLNVLENGNITPCGDFPDFIAGNLREESLRSIWNNQEMRVFRAELVRHGRFPICSRCSGLYFC